MRLVLVRHGRTASNVALLLDTAYPGAPLDEVGHSQAAALVDRLADEPIEGIYVSTLTRTRQTAAPLAERRGLDVTVLPGLMEIQAGAEELSADWSRYVEVLKAWAMGDADHSLPGGETSQDFFDRYDAAIRHIADQGHQVAMVVSHGAALRTWTGRRVSNLTPHASGSRRLDNTSVLIVEGSPEEGWTLIAWDGKPIAADEPPQDPTDG